MDESKFSFFDLSYDVRHLKLSLAIHGDPAMSQFLDFMTFHFLLHWPLAVACSLKLTGSDLSFRPDYLFPQFLLHWVTKNKQFDGIKYRSAQVQSKGFYTSNYINYAIPAKLFSETGYCSYLSSSFKISQPVTWNALELVNPDINNFSEEKFRLAKDKLFYSVLNMDVIETSPDQFHPYWRTKFGILETEISFLDAESI